MESRSACTTAIMLRLIFHAEYGDYEITVESGMALWRVASPGGPWQPYSSIYQTAIACSSGRKVVTMRWTGDLGVVGPEIKINCSVPVIRHVPRLNQLSALDTSAGFDFQIGWQKTCPVLG